jgi:DNA-binding NtrC family response regulator
MGHSVLVVDDQPIIRDMLKKSLARYQYSVHCAGSAQEALGILANEKVDVVISDEVMPGMSGTEFLTLVKDKFPDTVRIILTGQASLESTIKAINEGEIYRFLTKPCNIVDLTVTVRQAIEQKELVKENLRLLELVKKQASSIDEMEKKYPGISKVKKDAGGAIIIDDNDSTEQ